MGPEGLSEPVAAARGAAKAAASPDLASVDTFPGDPALERALALGLAHEQAQHPTARRARGAHFTPYDVAARLVALALDGTEPRADFAACDPACGAGVFLLAVAEALVARGWSRADAARAVHGTDIDPVTVDVARDALATWAGTSRAAVHDQVRVADALVDDPWPGRRFALVVGNPPFLGQLLASTVRRGAVLGAAPGLGAAGAPYVDTSALFLARGLDLVADGGRVALLQPQSVLVARDAQAVRTRMVQHANLRALWWAPEPLFAAHVRVCAPVLERTDHPALGATRIVRGRSFDDAGTRPSPGAREPWGGLVRDLLGVPAVALRAERRIGDLATATAGFRDEYYGLIGAVHEAREVEDRDTMRLVTCGLIDVLECHWGRGRTARFARHAYGAPSVDVAALEGRVATWAAAQRVPKLLLATQTKVIEVCVDETGVLLPSTPVVAVHAPAAHLWRLAAALSAPSISAHALTRVAGAALSAQSIKLAARQVLELPLPVDDVAWTEGAALAAQAHGASGAERAQLLDRLGVVMDRAYGVDDPAVRNWWGARRGPG